MPPVFYHFHAGLVAQNFFAIFYLADAANVEAHRSVEFQRITAGGGFGIAEHHADFFAQLVDENAGGVRLVDAGGEFAQCLRHQARLQTDFRVAHVAFEFGFRG